MDPNGTKPGAPLHCPHCGAEYTPSAIVTTCIRCGGELDAPPPKLDLPPPPDLSHVPTPAAAEPAEHGPAPRKEEREEPPPLLVPPPREVPVGLRLMVLFGGALSQFGWLFFGFGMVFVWVFGSFADFSWVTVWEGPWRTAEGTVTASGPTNMRVNEQRVYAHSYTFTTDDGRQHEGRWRGTGSELTPGSQVTVQYRAGNPRESRLRGTGAAFPLWTLGFILIFPAVGLAFIIPSLRAGVKANRLLAGGQIGTGTLKSMAPTGTRINDRMVYKLVFEFAASDGVTHLASAKTDEPARLQDQREEPLLYDPFDSTQAVMLDGLPGAPQIDPTGRLQAPPAGRVLGALIVPALTILGHGTYLCLRLLL